MNASELAKTIWLPFPPHFRRALLDATTTAFVGKASLRTSFGETVLLSDVLGYIHKAEGPLTSAFQKLSTTTSRAAAPLIAEFYPRLMPYYIGCGSKNPVHHTAYVIEFLTTILLGEGKTNEDDLIIGVLAALFHDVAQGLSKRDKITEAHIKDKIRQVVRGQATLGELQQYRDDAVRARQEHMREGAKIAGKALLAYQRQHPKALTDQTIREVQRLIEHHDDPKIPVAYGVIRRTFAEDRECRAWQAKLPVREASELSDLLGKTGDEYLIPVDDRRLQMLHEADLLWMLTQDGIEADLARFSPAEVKTPREIVDHNTDLHRQEVELYRDRPDFAAYGFREGTVYRSETGFALFEYLVQVLEERYP